MQLISASQGTTGVLVPILFLEFLQKKNKYNYLIKIFKIPPVKWFDRVWGLTVKLKCLTSRMSRGASLQTKGFFKNQYYNSNNKNDDKNQSPCERMKTDTLSLLF